MSLVSGPYEIESQDTVLRIAEILMPRQKDCTKEFYFKASFDKAKRASLESFRRHGLFFKTHFDPACALSDGPSMIRLNESKHLVEEIDAIWMIAE